MRIVHRGPIQLVAYYFEWSSHPLHQQGRESIFGMIGMLFACYLLNVILCVASGVYCHRLLKWIFCGVYFFLGRFPPVPPEQNRKKKKQINEMCARVLRSRPSHWGFCRFRSFRTSKMSTDPSQPQDWLKRFAFIRGELQKYIVRFVHTKLILVVFVLLKNLHQFIRYINVCCCCFSFLKAISV